MVVGDVKNSVTDIYLTQMRNKQRKIRESLEKGENLKANFKRVANNLSSKYMSSGVMSEFAKNYRLAASAYEKAYSWNPSNFKAIQRAASMVNLLA